MKGLLRKDLYMIWKYGRTLIVISALFLVLSIVSRGENFFFVIYPVLFGGVLPVTLLSYEERFGWDKLCDALPLSRRTVVCARYVTTLLCFFALYVLTLAALAFVLLPQGRASDLRELAALLPVFGLISPAVMLPLTLRFGIEKARIAYYALIGGVCALGVIIMRRGPSLDARFTSRDLTVSLLACVLVFAASWLLSIRLYEKREL